MGSNHSSDRHSHSHSSSKHRTNSHRSQHQHRRGSENTSENAPLRNLYNSQNLNTNYQEPPTQAMYSQPNTIAAIQALPSKQLTLVAAAHLNDALQHIMTTQLTFTMSVFAHPLLQDQLRRLTDTCAQASDGCRQLRMKAAARKDPHQLGSRTLTEEVAGEFRNLGTNISNICEDVRKTLGDQASVVEAALRSLVVVAEEAKEFGRGLHKW